MLQKCDACLQRTTDICWCSAAVVVVKLPQTPEDDPRSASAARGRRTS